MLELASEWKQRLLDEIAHAAYEHSSESQVAQAAGFHPRFISQARRRSRIQLDQAFALIAALGQDPGTFIARCLGHALPETPPPPPAEPNLAKPAQNLLRRARRRIEEPGAGTLPRSHLLYLDELRYGQPTRVRRLIEEQIDFVAPADVPLALGIWASSSRLIVDLDSARSVLDVALELSADQASERASMLQRRAYVDLYRGRLTTARSILEDARKLYLMDRETERSGTVLVDHALVAYHQRQPEETLDLLEQAAELVTAGTPRSRFALLLNRLLAKAELGLPTDPSAALVEAQTLSANIQPHFSRKVDWVLGLIERERDVPNARRLLWRHARYSHSTRPVEASQVYIDLAELELRQRQAAQAARLMEPLGPLLDDADTSQPETPWSRRRRWRMEDFERARELIVQSIRRPEIWHNRQLPHPD